MGYDMAGTSKKKARSSPIIAEVTANKEVKTMACNFCRKQIIGAVSVTTSGGVTTITLPADVSFVNGSIFPVGLFVPIPVGTNGTQVNVTNGTSTYIVMNRLANYWRPCRALQRGSVLRLRYLDDPGHLIVC